MTSARCFALVPCAGSGARAAAHGPKQYVMLAGRSVVAHTLAALARVPRIVRTLVVLALDDAQFEAAAPGFDGIVERVGGATRAASVAAGLDALRRHGAHDRDWVLVHDAARCLVQPAWIERLIDACIDDAVGGLLALPLSDTLKDAGDDGRVASTIDRAGKWAAQTPQMFRIGRLREALDRAGDGVTDDASAIEALGLAPRLVPGDVDNFKLTFAEDFARAEQVLSRAGAAASLALKAARVFVHDLASARRFYAGPIGLPLRVDGSEQGFCVFSLGSVDLVVEAVRKDDAPEDRALAGRFTGLSLEVDDLRASHAQLASAGVHFTGLPEAQFWGGAVATFEDPSGNQWQLVEYPKGKT